MLKPQPRVTNLNKPFWDGCNSEKLLVQCCNSCGEHVFYPRVCCPFCHEDTLEWKEVEATGVITSHTTIYRTHHDSFNNEAPYIFAVVQIDSGPYLYGQLLNTPIDSRSLIGTRVNALFVEHSPTQKIVAFEPV